MNNKDHKKHSFTEIKFLLTPEKLMHSGTMAPLEKFTFNATKGKHSLKQFLRLQIQNLMKIVHLHANNNSILFEN